VVMFNKKYRDYKPDIIMDLVDPKLIELLDEFDAMVRGKLYIHRMYDENAGHRSQHRAGRAADVHVQGMHVLDQWTLAERLPWGGLGVYGPDVWRHPGLHLDVRPGIVGARWGYRKSPKTERKIYVGLGASFIKWILECYEEEKS